MRRASRTPTRGFTLFEILVAMFILLVGLLGVTSVFGAGVRARLLAQELVISQELANMWENWIRFRLNESQVSGGPLGVLHLADLKAGAKGDFEADSGDFHFAPPGHPNNLPTYKQNAYRGFRWEITKVDDRYVPQWVAEDGSGTRPWSERLDGNLVFPPALGEAPRPLTAVELTIGRGSRHYPFHFVFSGVGIKYE